MKKLIALVLIAVFGAASPVAAATECFKTPEQVRAKFDAYPRYTKRMKDHRGEKCWYPEQQKHKVHIAQKVEVRPQAPIVAVVKTEPVLTAPEIVARAHASFPNYSMGLTFDERVMVEHLIAVGWHKWLQHSADRIASIR